MEQYSFINTFAKLKKAQEAAIFLGAGTSIDSGLPTWKTLLERCFKELNLENNSIDDLYLLAQYYVNENGKDELHKIILDEIDVFGEESKIINSILDLQFNSIWTTNFDVMIEKNLEKKNIIANVFKDDTELSLVRSQNKLNIFKMNGDIKTVQDIVITKDDWENYEKNHEFMLTFFKKELVSHTFLFLGYSFTDSLVLSCLQSLKEYYKGKKHYAILKDEKSTKFKKFVEDLESRYPLKIVLVENHEDIPKILDQIKEKIKSNHIFFSGVFEQLPQEEDEFALNLCNELIKALYKKKLIIHTGMGRRFGNYLAGSATKYLMSNNKEIEKNLIMRPFLENSDTNAHRHAMIEECKVAIFMFGKSENQGRTVNSRGVKEEFEISKKLKKIIIPLGVTGYASKDIYDEVMNNLINYPYLERHKESLLNEKDPERLSKTICSIIEETCN